MAHHLEIRPAGQALNLDIPPLHRPSFLMPVVSALFLIMFTCAAPAQFVAATYFPTPTTTPTVTITPTATNVPTFTPLPPATPTVITLPTIARVSTSYPLAPARINADYAALEQNITGIVNAAARPLAQPSSPTTTALPLLQPLSDTARVPPPSPTIFAVVQQITVTATPLPSATPPLALKWVGELGGYREIPRGQAGECNDVKGYIWEDGKITTTHELQIATAEYDFRVGAPGSATYRGPLPGWDAGHYAFCVGNADWDMRIKDQLSGDFHLQLHPSSGHRAEVRIDWRRVYTWNGAPAAAPANPAPAPVQKQVVSSAAGSSSGSAGARNPAPQATYTPRPTYTPYPTQTPVVYVTVIVVTSTPIPLVPVTLTPAPSPPASPTATPTFALATATPVLQPVSDSAVATTRQMPYAVYLPVILKS